MPQRVLSVGGPSHAWSGKLPGRGDFVEGGHRGLLAWMEDWASEGMVAIRAGGGPAADAFLTAQIQRFVGAPGALAHEPVIGVLGPGMDRAGRLYPFALACGLDHAGDPVVTWRANENWFSRAEALYLACLAPEFDPSGLDQAMAGLDDPAPQVEGETDAPGAVFGIIGGEPATSAGPPEFNALFAAAPEAPASQTAG